MQYDRGDYKEQEIGIVVWNLSYSWETENQSFVHN